MAHTGVGFGDAAVFASFLPIGNLKPIFLYVTARELIGSPNQTFVVSISWSVVGSVSVVSKLVYCVFPRKVLSHNNYKQDLKKFELYMT